MAGAGAGTAAGEEAAPPADGGGDAKPPVTPAEVLAMGKYLGVRLEVRALNPPPAPPPPRPRLRAPSVRPLSPSLGSHARVLLRHGGPLGRGGGAGGGSRADMPWVTRRTGSTGCSLWHSSRRWPPSSPRGRR